MKKSIHPTFYKEARITCNSCGKVYKLGATIEDLKVELCSNCHPFYTGKEILIDRENLVEKFQKKKEAAAKIAATVAQKKKEKKAQQKPSGGLTLKEMLANIK
jgi:large subunit ribosomal protein L31